MGLRIALEEAELLHHGEGALHFVHVGIALDAVVEQRAGIVVGDGGDACDTGQPPGSAVGSALWWEEVRIAAPL